MALLFSNRKTCHVVFPYFSMKTCCGYSLEAPIEVLLMSTHNICVMEGYSSKIYKRAGRDAYALKKKKKKKYHCPTGWFFFFFFFFFFFQ